MQCGTTWQIYLILSLSWIEFKVVIERKVIYINMFQLFSKNEKPGEDLLLHAL